MLGKLTFFSLYLTVSLFGLYQIKVAQTGWRFDYLIGVSAYAVGFLLWLRIVKLLPLSSAFPIAAGALILGTQLIGLVFLRESFDRWKVAGVALLLAGLVALAISESRSPDA